MFTATYRLQLHADFTFNDASALTEYLHSLGISHVYPSPYFQARPGSRHGYDVCDHTKLNPEIGSDEDFLQWMDTLKRFGMSQLIDLVPNHMGIVGNENRWWYDVLENGQASKYAPVFDIDWDAVPHQDQEGRVLLPILGEPYGQALESQKLRLTYEQGRFAIEYFDHHLPVAPRSYGLILGHRPQDLQKLVGPDDPAVIEYLSILTAVKNLPRRTATDPEALAERRREKEVIKRRLAALTAANGAVASFVENLVIEFNGTANQPHSFDLLDELVGDQVYRLAYWRVAPEEINYRRFLDINDLAAISVERPEVFAVSHQLALKLLHDGHVAGLRIDHPDGLFDPRGYLQRLQEAARAARPDLAPVYIVVEKILGQGEILPADWPVAGTTGYDFLNQINGIFVDTQNAREFLDIYRKWTGELVPLDELVYQNKRLVLQVALASELNMLALQLDRLAQKNRHSRDFTLSSLRTTLRETIACFPVYRSYIVDRPSITDRENVQLALHRARRRNPTFNPEVFRFLRDMLLLEYPEGADAALRAEQDRFVGKFQQVTTPVMVKGLEDTAFYIYNVLVSLNDVGGDPKRFGIEPPELHGWLAERQRRWPAALSATSTHDTKRSEDVRARLNALSEIPAEWAAASERWSRLNEAKRPPVDERPAPDANEEYLIYQTLLGAFPIEQLDDATRAVFVKRIQDYMIKALHEAKVHSSWINPNEEYDKAVCAFVATILDPAVSADFLSDFRPLQRRLSNAGMFNSLAQTLLKITAPGVPDFYQGSELWDFSLVDPDNRRPVDFALRQRVLKELNERLESNKEARHELAKDLVFSREDGRIKLYLIWRALECRRAHADLFAAGEYLPLQVQGARERQVFGFFRLHASANALVVVPRLVACTLTEQQAPLDEEMWLDTKLVLPAALQQRPLWNVFTDERLGPGSELRLADVFRHFPVALLVQ